MPQIAAAQIRACYDAALQVRLGSIGATAAMRRITADTGMTAASALDYINIIRHLINGDTFTRTMNPMATDLILTWIAQDFGYDIAKTAAGQVLTHIEYYAGLPKGGPQTAVHAVAQSHLNAAPLPSLLTLLTKSATDLAAALARSPAAREARLAAADPMPKSTLATTKVYLRNMDVVATVLLRANGTCETCKSPAPFLRRADSTPYLEVHHILPLARNGPDTVENATALCPNCHRRAHHGPP